jgi:peroxiredoxin
MRFVPFALLALIAYASSSAAAGEYNPVLSVGDPAPVWKDLPGIDGKKHSLADLKEKQAVVVVFTCNSCPYAVDYEDRIIAFARRHGGPESKVALVAINVNKIEEDSLPKMQERAKLKGFNFPYLYDDTQKIAKDFGATFTPEFFVLDKDRKVVYMGAMDDKTDPAQAKVNYVQEAVDAALAGAKPATGETVARGCTIRYARERRKPSGS